MVDARMGSATAISPAARDAFAGERRKICYRQQRHALFLGCGKDGCGQRMFAGFFQAGRGLQELRLLDALGRDDFVQPWFAFGEGSGFVHHQGGYFLQRLQGFRITHQNARSRSAPCAHHDRHRCCQAERTGAGNNEHRHRVHQGVFVAWLRAQNGPPDEGNDSSGQDCGNEVAGDTVRESLDRSACSLRFAHHLHDLRQQRGSAHALRLHHQGAGSVDGSTDYAAADRLLDRNGFPGDHGFVDGTATLHHDAVDRHFFAGANTQQVADGYFAEGDVGFLAAGGDAARGLWGQAE